LLDFRDQLTVCRVVDFVMWAHKVCVPIVGTSNYINWSKSWNNDTKKTFC
jgi:hypothetical protein